MVSSNAATPDAQDIALESVENDGDEQIVLREPQPDGERSGKTEIKTEVDIVEMIEAEAEADVESDNGSDTFGMF